MKFRLAILAALASVLSFHANAAIGRDNHATSLGTIFCGAISYTTGTLTNGVMFVFSTVVSTGDTIVPAYNGVAMTPLGTSFTTPFASPGEVWWLANPAAGSHMLTWTCSNYLSIYNQGVYIATYSGANQSAQPDNAVASSANNVSSLTGTVTTTQAGDWLFFAVGSNTSTPTAGAGTTLLDSTSYPATNTPSGDFDSNGTVSVGSNSLIADFASASYVGGVVFGICPATASTCGTPPPPECTAKATGNVTSAATWTCNNTDTTPQDGDIVNIGNGYTVTLNGSSLGTTTGIPGINISGGASLVTDGAAMRSILLASTGSTPGTNMYGITIAGGTFSTAAATSYATRVKLSAPGGNPVFITGSGSGSAITLDWFDCEYCGVNASTYTGIYGDGNTVINTNHFYCFTCYIPVFGYKDTGTITNSTFNLRWGPESIFQFGNGPCGNTTNNTDIARTATGDMYTATYNCQGQSFSGNAFYSATETNTTDAILSPGNSNVTPMGSAATLNICSCGALLSGTGYSGDPYTLSDNIIDYASIHYGANYVNSSGNIVTQTSANAGQQGCYIALGQATAASLSREMCWAESNSNNFGMLVLGAAGANPTQISIQNVSFNIANVNTGGGGVLGMGETNAQTYYLTNSIAKNNILTGGSYGMLTTTYNTFSTTGCLTNSVGVCNNLVQAITATYSLGTSPAGGGFDNGTTIHPNALYGDLSVSPAFYQMRDQPAADKWLGGPGTLADLYAGLADRWCNGCGSFSYAAPFANYNIQQIYNYMASGFTPQNASLSGASDGGSYIGAMKPTIIQAGVLLQ